MSLRTYGMLCLAWCGVGCQAQIDFSGVDAGVGTGGLPSVGGAKAVGDSLAGGGANNGGDSTLSGGTGAITNQPCDANVHICESPVVLVSNMTDAPCTIVSDATYVYWWADCTTGELKKVPVDGGSPTTVVTGQGSTIGLEVDATYAYWIHAEDYGTNNAVRKVPLSGGAPTTLASGFEISYFAVGAKSVVFTNYTGCVHTTTGHVGYELISVPIEGGTSTTLFSDFSEEAYPTGVTVDDTNAYWSHGRFPTGVCQITVYTGEEVLGGTVLKIPLGGGTPKTLVSGRRQPSGIVVDDTNVYWDEDMPSTVMSVPIDAGTSRTLASCQDAPYGCTNVAVDGMYVYWGDNRNVRRMPRGGGVPETLVTTLILGAIAVDAANLYWVDLGDGTRGAASLMKLRLH